MADNATATRRFDAFMSYSHAADARFAPFLQSAVQGFAKPWYRLRRVRIFRDQTGLALTPELWPEIEGAMNVSEAFILLASPEAAASKWVRLEIGHWLTLQRGLPLIVVTGGAVKWDSMANEFDWLATTALPQTLAGVYRTEPLYLDTTEIKTGELSARHAKIRNAAAQIYSRLTGQSLDEVIGEDVRQHRRNQWTGATALATVAALGVMYALQRVETHRQETIAMARRQLEVARSLAAESLSRNGGPAAVNVSEIDSGRAAILAVESANLVPTLEGIDALRAHLEVNPKITGERSLGEDVRAVALSPDGRTIATADDDGRIRVSPAFDPSAATEFASTNAHATMVLANNGSLFTTDGSRVAELTTGRTWPGSASSYRVSPDGYYYAATTAATEEAESSVALWTRDAPAPVGRWNTGRPMSAPIAFSANSRFLAFVEHDRVAVVDVETRSVRYSQDSGLIEITGLAVDATGGVVLVFGWGPDARYVVKKSFVLRAFPVTGDSMFRPIYYRGDSHFGIRSLAIDVSSRIIAFSGGPPGWIKVMDYIDTSTVAVIREDNLVEWTLTTSSGQPEIVTATQAGVRRRAIRREPAETAGPPVHVRADYGPTGAVSGDGSTLAVGGMRGEARSPFAMIVDAKTGQTIRDIALSKPPEKLLLSPRGGLVAVWAEDGPEVFSTATGRGEWPTEHPKGVQPLHLAFSRDDRTFAWGEPNAGVFLKDLSSPARVVENGPVVGLESIAVSSTGSAVAWSFRSRSDSTHAMSRIAIAVRNGNAPSQVLASIDLDLSGGGSTSLAFDGSGRRLVVAMPAGSIRIYDVRKKRLLASFFYEGQTYSVAFDDTDKYLLTTGTGGMTEGGTQFEVAVWSVRDGRRIWRRQIGSSLEGFSMEPNNGPVVLARSTSLSPSGSLGISADRLFWQTRDLVRIGCERIRYRLTPEERDLFLPDSGSAPCPR